VVTGLLLSACASPLGWMEAPNTAGGATCAPPEDQARFLPLSTFEQHEPDPAHWEAAVAPLREGDVIGYRMGAWEARALILTGRLNALGYRLFRYGHLAIVARDPDADDGGLAVFSSQSFMGPNTAEGIETLKDHSWDAYRLDRWDRVDAERFEEFIAFARAKAGAWYGYDFSGMFALWNSNLDPTDEAEIGHDYICSTVVVAALHYAGLKLDAWHRDGYLDLVTPYQVLQSRGRFIPLPERVEPLGP